MHRAFAFSLKGTVTAVILSGFIAAGVAELNSPSVAGNAEAITISINRTHKGDRLPQRSLPHHPTSSTSPEMVPAPPKRVPLGCDPAFSPVADPARAHIFKRCIV